MSTAPLCTHCSAEVAPGDRFCESCGADLLANRAGTSEKIVTGPEGPDGPAAAVNPARPCRGCGSVERPPAGSDYCPTCGLRRDDGSDRIELDLGPAAGVSDRGLVHARNEDAMALGWRGTPEDPDRPTGVAVVVCDGVSSVTCPEKASRAATEVGLDVLLGVLGDARPIPAERTSREAVAAAAKVVAAMATPAAIDSPSCTYVSALIDLVPADGSGAPEITVAWVGDSRAYWLALGEPGGPEPAEPSRALTADHSWAAELVAAGVLDEAAAMASPKAHAITRWLGADAKPKPDVVTLRPRGPGVLLVCSDGLWNYLPDADELATAALPAAFTEPLRAAIALTALALEAGGRDNITVVAVPVPAAHEQATQEQARQEQVGNPA